MDNVKILDLDDMIKHLYRSAWIQVMDLVTVYSLSMDVRLKNGWTSLCKTHPKNPSKLIYDRDDGNRNYFCKDFDHARVDLRSAPLKVHLPPGRQHLKLREEYDDDLGDFVIATDDYISARELQQINEKFADFDVKIAEDINLNRDEYRRNLLRLRMLDASAEKAKKAKEGNGSISQEKLISIFCRADIGILTLQGPPGTGKTTFLADCVEALIAQGIKPEDITCLAFTKRAAEEIHNKLAEKFGHSKHVTKDLVCAINEGIRYCDDKIYVGNIHKNPTDARGHKRKYVLVDEVSQITLPILLYGLRYATDDAVLRLFGDEEQLPPVQPYVRCIDATPKGSWQDIGQRYIALHDDVYLGAFITCFKDDFVFGDLEKRDQLVYAPLLRKLQQDQLNSIWGQSIFSISEYICDNNMETMLEWASYINDIKFTLKKGYRQEQPIHDKTHFLSYGHIKDHECAFDVKGNNIREAHEIYKKHKGVTLSARGWLQHLCNDLPWFESYYKKIRELIVDILEKVFHRRSIDQDLRLTEEEKAKFDNPIHPFQGQKNETIHAMMEEYVRNPDVQKIFPASQIPIDGPSVIKQLLPSLRKNIIIIRHNYVGDGGQSLNTLEIWLAVLMIRLWRSEALRIQHGLGVVTPYRMQENEIYRFYVKCFQDHVEFRKERKWCATPERFQGRDISRGIVSLVTTDNKPYLEACTMFTKNKFNVATSRAGSQQVIIGHESLFSREAFKKYISIVDSLDHPEQDILKKYPVQYREKVCRYFEECEKDQENCAIVSINRDGMNTK